MKRTSVNTLAAAVLAIVASDAAASAHYSADHAFGAAAPDRIVIPMAEGQQVAPSRDSRQGTASESADSIDLLEAIGSNASLRYATATELVHMLERANASSALTHAVMSGDSTRLSEQLLRQGPLAPQVDPAFCCVQT
ncbi:hypothetical protein [Dyella silvae]|uniref:hypothetical protein n=1 Tax=Dyella silvae TaxID=2994424 RepID=UPI002263C71F|nr:hypothetical protein [Dyella silvae]